MERRYELTLEIGGHRREVEKEIRRVCMVEWAFKEGDFTHERAQDQRNKWLLTASAIGSVFESEDIAEIVARIERAVWRANGGMCHVQVTAAEFGRVERIPGPRDCADGEERLIA
jgi:hypothetical protein